MEPVESYFKVTQFYVQFDRILSAYTMKDVLVVDRILTYKEAVATVRSMHKLPETDINGVTRFYAESILWFDGKGNWLAPWVSPSHYEWLQEVGLSIN